ncbi:MAG: hypothetical protein J0L87_10495 [Bacteroidetes bacterium]|nr:hypothetical protein [Bacteroidota bacterium]
MKKIALFLLLTQFSFSIFGQKKSELPNSHFMVDVLDVGSLCNGNDPIIRKHIHINKDTVLFDMYCKKPGSEATYLVMIDVSKNKLIKSKKMNDSYFEVLDGYKLMDKRLIKVWEGEIKKDGSDIYVTELDMNTMEIKTLLNAADYYPDGLKGINLFKASYSLGYMLDSKTIVGSYSIPGEKKVNGKKVNARISTAFIIDCANKKIKTFEDFFYSYQPGTPHPHKFFDQEKNGDVFISACKTYQIPDPAKMTLSQDMNYDHSAHLIAAEIEKKVILRGKLDDNVGYVIEEANNGKPLIYYGMRPPRFSTKELKQQLNAFRMVIQDGKTQYKPIVNRLLLDFNLKKEYPLYYLEQENKFLCRDTLAIKKGIDLAEVIFDKDKSNKTINDYNTQSVKAFRNELKPDYTLVPLQSREIRSFEKHINRNRIKAFNYDPTNKNNIVLVYADFIAYDNEVAYLLPFKDCKSAYMIGKDSLVMANDVRCIVVSLSKKATIMDIDLGKINSSYTPYYMQLSGGGAWCVTKTRSC